MNDHRRCGDHETTTEVWHRQSQETGSAYAAFSTYLGLGPRRTHEATRQALGRPTGYTRLIELWSARFAWIDRARAYDNRMIEIEHEAKARVRADEAAKWEKRRMEAADANWEMSEKIRLKAAEMLDSPLYEEKTSEDGAVVKKPVRWNLATAGALCKVAAELQAAALQEALGDTDDFDPSTATLDECRAFLRREGVLNAAGEMKALPGPAR